MMLVSNTPPIPATTGGNQRTALLARALQRLGSLHTVLLCRPQGIPQADRERMEQQVGLEAIARASRLEAGTLRQRVTHNLVGARARYDVVPEAREAVWEAVQRVRPDVVVCRMLRPAKVGDVLNAAASVQARVILDIDDLDWRVYASRLEHGHDGRLGRTLIKRHLQQIQTVMPAWLTPFEHVWLASPADVPLVQHPHYSVLPNIPYTAGDTIPEPPAFDRAAPQPRLLIVASMNHGPNARGVKRFLQHVWPSVHQQCPEASLQIVGSKMSEAQTQAWQQVPGVEVLGYVADLRAVYAQAWAAVSPIYEGGGTKIKVLESLMHARPIAVTPHSHYGYETTLPDGMGLRRGEDDAGLAAACVTLLGDRQEAQAVGQRGFAAVEQHYTFDRFASVVRDAVERVMMRANERSDS